MHRRTTIRLYVTGLCPLGLPADLCAGGPEIDCTDITDSLDDDVGMQLSKVAFYVDQIGVQQALEPEAPIAHLQRQAMYEVSNHGRRPSVVGKGMLFVGMFGWHAEHVSPESSPPHRR